MDEPVTAVVTAAAQAAGERQLALEVALVAVDDASTARCMATMDDAVQTAMSAVPHLEVRVEMGPLDADRLAGLQEDRYPIVVISRETRDSCAARGELQWIASRLTVM